MTDKAPMDFDAEWYRKTYPDVSLCGMDPLEHFLRFGRLMGRKPNSGMPPAQGWAVQGPIIPRPEGFDPAQVVPQPLTIGMQTLTLSSTSLEDLLHALPKQNRGPLVAYARIVGPAGGQDAPGPVCGPAFRSGETRIETAWHPGAGLLRLRLAGAAQEGAAACSGWSLRAYQAAPADPHSLLSGAPLVLPALGPVFYDIELIHPLMPVLLALSDAEGVVQETALMAFPSLLPGGLHATEAKALQGASHPMDAFWALTEQFVAERLGKDGWPARSITGLRVALRGASGAEPVFAAALQDWLKVIFGLDLRPDATEGMLTFGERMLQAALAAPEGAAGSRAGVTLHLPHDGIPTIAALVSNRLDGGPKGRRAAAYLVAEEHSLRPRWQVSPPPTQGPETGMPVLSGPATAEAAGPATVPVAILFRPKSPPHNARLLLPAGVAADPEVKVSFALMLVAEDPLRTANLLALLLRHGPAEVHVRLAGDRAELSRVLDKALGAGKWSDLGAAADLRDIARTTGRELILSISDRIMFYDATVPAKLAELLEAHPKAASASCLLLGETIIKKQATILPASGGLFPGQVNFAAAPTLGFIEPDTYQALPCTTYPVVANTPYLALWRRAVLADLPRPSHPLPAGAADIELGLAAVAQGFENICTSTVRAGYVGTFVRRDAIDPLGSAALQPGLWQEIFSRVTVLRELF